MKNKYTMYMMYCWSVWVFELLLLGQICCRKKNFLYNLGFCKNISAGPFPFAGELDNFEFEGMAKNLLNVTVQPEGWFTPP